MPTYLRGQPRDILRFVKLYDSPQFYYGWNTKDLASVPGVSEADILSLGHIAPVNVPQGAIRCFAANTPVPPRVKKVINKNPSAAQQGSTSTFAAPERLKEAETQGWKVTARQKTVAFRSNDRTVSAGAELEGGGVYVFPLNKLTFDQYGAELGLKAPGTLTANQRRGAFTGTSRPRPAVVSFAFQDGSTLTTFCSTANIQQLLQAGWQVIEEEFPY
jgi:hypothetical protein